MLCASVGSWGVRVGRHNLFLFLGVATAQHVKTIQSENAGRNWPRAHDLSMFCFPSLIVIGFVWRKHPVHRCPVMQTKER